MRHESLLMLAAGATRAPKRRALWARARAASMDLSQLQCGSDAARSKLLCCARRTTAICRSESSEVLRTAAIRPTGKLWQTFALVRRRLSTAWQLLSLLISLVCYWSLESNSRGELPWKPLRSRRTHGSYVVRSSQTNQGLTHGGLSTAGLDRRRRLRLRFTTNASSVGCRGYSFLRTLAIP